MARKKKKPQRPNKEPEYESTIRNAVRNGEYTYTQHATQRMCERRIDDEDVKNVLLGGRPEPAKDQFLEDSWRYAFKGKAFEEDRNIRVIAGIDEQVVIVTVIAVGEDES